MTPVAVYDANVLYPSALRDFLIRLAIEDLVQARWSDRILDEVFRNIAINRPDLDRERLLRTRQRMCAAVLDCLVSGFEDLEAAVTLPDPDDRHVVAAAIRSGAGNIVTFNLGDSPRRSSRGTGSLRCTRTSSLSSCSHGAQRRCWTSSGRKRLT